MGRKIIDCSEMPSDINCTLTISGTDDEVMKAAVEHAISTHGHTDSPQLRDAIRGMMKEAAPA